VARVRRSKPQKRTKKTDRRRSCSSGKQSFNYRGEANAAILPSKQETLVAYRCRECKRWHLANKVGRKERRRRAKGDL